MMRSLLIALPRCADTMRKREMTPEALKLLPAVLARDGGFFDIKANVAARTELGASGYLRIEPHGKQCPMGRTALALGSKEQPVE